MHGWISKRAIRGIHKIAHTILFLFLFFSPFVFVFPLSIFSFVCFFFVWFVSVLEQRQDGAPVRPMPLSTVVLTMVGMAWAYRGCRQKGHMKGQAVRSSSAGTTDARGV